MTASRRLAVTMAAGTMLTIVTAALVCVPLRLGAGWLYAVCASAGPFWALIVDRAIGKAKAAREWLQGASRGVQDGDWAAMLALFAMRPGPARLADLVMVLNPRPDMPPWRHPMQRWNVTTAWVVRSAELLAQADRLVDAGLLRCTERGRRYWDMGIYEATGLGRDVAARNAEVLMAGRAEEGT